MAYAPSAPVKSVPLTCSGHTRPVVHLEFSELQEDGTYTLLSSCKDGNPMLRDWLGDWIGTFLGHKGAVWCGRLSGGEAARAVTGSADFSAKVWDTFTGECLETFPHNHIVRSVAIDAGGHRVLTAGHERKLRLFDLARDGAQQPQLFRLRPDEEVAHEGNIKSVVWLRGGGGAENTIVSAGEDKVIRWWDLRTQGVTHKMSFDDPIASLERCQAPSGELLSVTSGRRVLFLDAARPGGGAGVGGGGGVVLSHELSFPPSSASLHPTLADRFVAGSTSDGWVRILDAQTGEGRELHKGHHGPAHAVSYSPDGELAASGSEDGTIRLWQTWPGRSYGLWQAST